MDINRESNRAWQQRSRDTARQCAQDRRRRDETARTGVGPSKRREAAKQAPRPGVKAKTAKRAGQEREYTKNRREYLERNPVCHCCIERKQPAPNPASQVHHTAGRDGEKLNDIRFWMAICEECHALIHANPQRSHRKGWLISRLIPESHQEFDLYFRRGMWSHMEIKKP